jgi:catechol 2,3-dioxygenase-like lactoylglutathione lyase family enzyme
VQSYKYKKQYFGGKAMKKNYITRISAVEVPVSNLVKSIDWYTRILGLEVQHKDLKTAMLTFNALGVPGVFLCETESNEKLQFINTNNDVTHSVIDFFTADLIGFYNFLIEQGVKVGKLNMNSDFGGFGFEDPNGNLLSACNAIQRGQE